MVRINGCYFSDSNKYGIRYAMGAWAVYRLGDNFKGYYVKSYKYLRDAIRYVREKEAVV